MFNIGSSEKHSGYILNNGSIVASTQQCVHCGNHEVIRPGSGTKRGWCNLCHGFLCGKYSCMITCIPFAAKLDYQDALNRREENKAAIRSLLNRYPDLQYFKF